MHHAFIDKFAHLKSPIHGLDPRAKIISFFFFVLIVVLTANGEFTAFGLFFLLVVAALLISRVPLMYVFKHSLVVIPFVAIVGLSLLFKEGGAVVFSVPGFGFSVSNEGLLIFFSVVAKSWLSVLAMLVLVSTTPFPCLLKGLEWFRVPSLVLMIISFMYRYIFLITDEIMRIKNARDSRGTPHGTLDTFRSAGCLIGSLFVRSYERAENAFLAMCSRGFDGEMRSLHTFSFKAADSAFVLLFCSSVIAIAVFA